MENGWHVSGSLLFRPVAREVRTGGNPEGGGMTLYSSSTGGALAPSIAVGFALAAGVLIGGPLTGGGVNPARALGPMIVSEHLSR